jgi:hypothetical protein
MTVQRIIGSETIGNAVAIGPDAGQLSDSGVKIGAANGPVLFANLPVSPTVGLMYVVTDATTETWGASATQGGGAYTVLVWWNGANWRVAGK